MYTHTWLLVAMLTACATAQAQNARPLCETSVAAGTMRARRPFEDRNRNAGEGATVVGQVIGLEGSPLLFQDMQLPTTVALYRRLGDTIRIAQTRTDRFGAFRLDSISPGKYYLSVGGALQLRQWHELQLLAGIADSICVRMRIGPVEQLPPIGTGEIRRLPNW